VNTLLLKYVVEVERTGSVTKAADRLYMNQPHLSKKVQELEQTLGIEIFKRTSKGMTPTKKGVKFLEYAKNILTQIEKMKNFFDEDASQKMTFSIAVPRASYISHAFAEFIKATPKEVKMDVDYRETNNTQTMENVAEGISNLGIIRFQADYAKYFEDILSERNLCFRQLYEFEYLMLLSECHALAAEDVVDCSKLGQYIEITHGDLSTPSLSSPWIKHMAPEASRRGEISIYERGSQFEILNKVHTTYMWVSPMPDDVLRMFSLVQKKSNMPNNRHRDLLIYRSEYQFSAEDTAFIEKLDETMKTLLPV
jgi:DNA-binding transcriptional LysR family regulator